MESADELELSDYSETIEEGVCCVLKRRKKMKTKLIFFFNYFNFRVFYYSIFFSCFCLK